MYKIGICDDMPEMCDIILNQLKKETYTEQSLEFYIYHSAKEILDASPELDILFLDIEMPGMTGMELMEQHGALFEDTKVVFLTSYTNYVYSGYKVKAFRFLQKPADTDDLRELFKAVDKENVLNGLLTLPGVNMEQPVQLRFKDILYIESTKNYSNIITSNNIWECKATMKEILTQLPEQFFYQTHKSYIINMKHVLRIFQKERRVLMSNGSKVDISYRKRTDFIDAYMLFSRR